MGCYIKGSACISPQETFQSKGPIESPVLVEGRKVVCMDPDFKEFIAPRAARRMSTVVKRGVAAAKASLSSADEEKPNAILTGTGLGSMAETEKFLTSLIEKEGETLNPSPFIQSTHNTVGGQLAISLGCKEHNHTYVHRGASFESALMDGMMLIEEGKDNVMVGGYDELTDNYFSITSKLGYWREKPMSNLDLFKEDGDGTLAGEGSSFFILSPDKGSDTVARLKGLEIVPANDPRDPEEVVEAFLSRYEVSDSQVDLLLSGRNGDRKVQQQVQRVEESVPKEVSIAGYKNLCGEFFTAGGFGLWLTENMMRNRMVPPASLIKGEPPEKLDTILVHSTHLSGEYSLILVEAC